MDNTSVSDRMVILGSGGARIVVAKQLRASGGIWFSLAGTRFLVDPGPGALVRMTGSRHRLDPTKLAGILLSHRHLDHSGDVNNMIEAMTMGGTELRGMLFAPSDALGGDDPVVLKYVRPFLEKVVTLEDGGSYKLGNVRFTCPVRHQHRGEVYGFKFRTERGQKPEARMQNAEGRNGLTADYADSADDVGPGQKAERRSGPTADYADSADGAGRRQRTEAQTELTADGADDAGRNRKGLSADYADYTDGQKRSEATADGVDDADGSGGGQKPEAGMPEVEGRASGGQGSQSLDPSISRSLDPLLTISYIADTRYFPELAEHYRADVVIMNVVRPTPSQLDHLSAPDAEELVKAMRPKLTVLGHFGMRMLAAKPWVVAREMSERTGCKVVAASDGMLIDLEQVKVSMTDSQLLIPNTGAA